MPERPTRADYGWFCHLATRWMDNDVYGHVNNVTYYSYFDTAANRYLIEHGGLDIHAAPVVGFVVSSSCEFHAPVAFPDDLAIGLRVERLGGRSATYGFAVFCGDEDQARATASFTHVFVERASGKAVAIPAPIRSALECLT